MKRRQDIDSALAGWAYKPDIVQARIVNGGDGRDVLQMRLEMGIIQMEFHHRPDGIRPMGFDTYFDYLKSEATRAKSASESFVLGQEQCNEADREFLQYYHRRIAWLALSEYGKAVADADHTLAFMDFIRDHSPSEDYTLAHEQYRGFVLFHRTQAEAAARAEEDDPEGAVSAIQAGAKKIGTALAEFDPEFEPESDPMLRQLTRLAEEIKKRHNVKETLQEQLDKAIAKEDYEAAASLRDQIRRRTAEPGSA